MLDDQCGEVELVRAQRAAIAEPGERCGRSLAVETHQRSDERSEPVGLAPRALEGGGLADAGVDQHPLKLVEV